MQRTIILLATLALMTAFVGAEPLGDPADVGIAPTDAEGRPYARGARFPSLSPDGETLLFVYHGDLWRVPSDGGAAARLTDHEAWDGKGVWSLDGQWIAFTSERDGSGEVYVMPAQGGVPRRLTFHSNWDAVYAFSPDGQWILFGSYRNGLGIDLYKIPFEGGTPEKVTEGWGRWASWSADGQLIAYNRGSSQWWRKGYRGSTDTEIYVWPLDGRLPWRVTDNDWYDNWPTWTPEGKIVYASEESGVSNIWSVDPMTKEREQLTFHPGDGVQFPSVAARTGRVAYEESGHIWILDPGLEPRAVPLYIAADEKTSLVRREEITSGASDLDLSPDASRAAFVVHGQIFVVDVEDGGGARRMTHSHARDRWPKWMPDGETIVFNSDRREQADMWRTSAPEFDVEEWAEEDEVTVADHPAVPAAESLTDTPTDEREPLISPDGEWIAYQTPNDDVWVLPADGGEAHPVARGPQIYIPVWSPDSRWIAYEQHDASDMGDIFVVSVDGGDPINITQDPAHDQVPFWSPDGFMLGYESDKADDWDLWYVELVTEDEARILKRKWKKEHESGDNDEDGEEPEPIPIPIKVDGEYTPHRITTTPGRDEFAAWCPDTTWIAYRGTYQGEEALLAVKKDGTGLKKLSDAAPSELPRWDSEGSKVVYISNGSIKTAELEGADGSVDFTAEMVVDRPSEFLQMYNEAWRQLKNNFYDETMHGVDWDAVRAKYLPLAEAARTQDELHLAISEVLGELRASHLGIWPGGGGGRRTGYLGFDMELREKSGRRGWMVTDIMPEGPAERFPERIRVGDFLLSIDGISLDASSNVDSLLYGKAGEDVRLIFGDLPGAAAGRPVLLEAESRSEHMNHFYDRLVEKNRRLVESLSEDRIGYLHIRSMNQRSLERFRREIRAELPEHEALIIDVRFNGGGNIHQELIEILDSRPIVRYKPRDGMWHTQPATAFFGPKAVLINEYSFSDAELFPQAFRELGLGPLIGVPTGGGVIGTGGTTLLDGSWLRLPSTGWQSLDGQNLENYGVPPDIEVDMSPADWLQGKDPQIEAAVEYLLNQLRQKTSVD